MLMDFLKQAKKNFWILHKNETLYFIDLIDCCMEHSIKSVIILPTKILPGYRKIEFYAT